jgi:hypothetical protein
MSKDDSKKQLRGTQMRKGDHMKVRVTGIELEKLQQLTGQQLTGSCHIGVHVDGVVVAWGKSMMTRLVDDGIEFEGEPGVQCDRVGATKKSKL